MVSVLRYTVLRLGLFVLVLGILAALRAGPILALGLAAVISFLLSYVLLRRQRDQVAAQVAGRIERRLARGGGPGLPGLDDGAADEDAVLDARDRAESARTSAQGEPDGQQ